MDLEEQLAEAAIAGDETAFLQLMKSYKVDLYKTSLSYLRNEHEAIEVVQEVTYRAYKNLRNVKEPAFFKTWLIRIMINYCNDQLKLKKRVVYDDRLLSAHGIEDEHVQLEVDEALQLLDERSRELVTLKYIHGLKIKEISAEMECPEGTVKMWLHKALKSLREKLEEKGGGKNGEKLAEYRKQLYEVEVPMDLLDGAIEAGLEKAKLEKKRRPRRVWLLSVALVAIVLVGFSGIGKMLELIKHDKGLVAAIENSYYQGIWVSEKKNGLEFVIDGAIADEMGLVLFYTINADEKQTNLRIEKINLKGLDSSEISPSSISFGSLHDEVNRKKSSSGTVEFFFRDPLTAKKFQLDIEVIGDEIQEELSLNFSLTKEIQKKKVYPLNKTVVIEGQKIYLDEAIVYPLRVAVSLKVDPNNTKELMEIEDFRLVDENGEVWSKITNGTTRSGISEHEFIYYLQSNYFKEPEELYLAFGKIQAIDKEYSAVVVDTEQKKILKQPPGNKLRDLEISDGNISMNLYTEEEFPYGIFSEVVDGNGNNIYTDSNYMSRHSEKGYTHSGVGISNLRSYPNPLSLKLSFFPEWIIGDEKIRIK